MLNWVIENKELIKIFYGVLIGLVCMIIVLKTHRLFRLSLYQGIRYFRNAFLFFGLAFLTRYLLGGLILYNYLSLNFSIVKILFEFFLIIGGFTLVYSLLWKKLETYKDYSSLLNMKILLFYALAFTLVFLDYLWETYSLMFFSQIILFFYASIISYLNYRKDKKQHKFLKFYLMAMFLSLTAWILNALAGLYFEWNQGVMINIYIINLIIFLLFLFGVINATKK